ncbi:hypothetical protein [Paenibacillus montanisoli]|uniref:ABC transporter substrate-binding protein n=1 Tax=Paenibacillus montanisoli TaxID=2081970 RepID=A0A328UC21_9BACL|nr:hypothetical protein [Paenibacillus montanisoli]RAP77894.1 hypothetical protein DL346_05410 [Paenibacillus montanisoli]
MGKKLLGITLSFVLVFSVLLAGCSSNNNTNDAKDSATNSTTNNASTNDTSNQASTDSNQTSTNSSDPNDPAANFKPIEITMLGDLPVGGKTATEDVLTPIWREKTKVSVKVVGVTAGQSGDEFWQKQIVADTLPDLINLYGVLGPQYSAYKLMKQNNQLREIKKEDIEKYMPRFKAYLEKMGGNIDDLYKDNLDADGKMWWMPSMPSQAALPTYLTTKWWANRVGEKPYYQYVRDDVLKKIFPNAKTEQELKDLYNANGAKLTYEDVNDIPIHNQAELLDFYRKVQALDIKVGDKKTYVHPQSSSQNVNSILWSMYSATGNMWSFTAERSTKGDVMTYIPWTNEWKDYIKMWNTMYQEKILDPGTFVQKDDQLNAKIINGEYVVFNQWGPVNDARALSKKENRGYGYRILSLFPGHQLNNKYQDLTYFPANLDGSGLGVGINAKVSDEKYIQILNWLDWNMSEEAAELRAWGLPEWSTGTGEDRRFKPEYKALEDWAVRGVKSEKDGNYYGMYDPQTNSSIGAQAWNAETFGVQGLFNPYQPAFVYPAEPNPEVNLDNVVLQLNSKYHSDQQIFFHQVGWTWGELDPDGAWAKADQTNGVYSDAAKVAVVQAIIQKPDKFDDNYAKYMKVMDGGGFKDEEKKMEERWKTLYAKMLPEIEKVKK